MRLAAPVLLSPLAILVMLSACDRPDPQAHGSVQRVQLQGSGQRAPTAEISPDTSAANWTVSQDGQAIRFGNTGETPLLTLACDLEAEPIEFVVIRHARAFPGQGALFPVIGNGINSRFLADAVLADGEWHWEARVPADDPQLEVFSGRRDLIATLPGHGTLEIPGGRITGEFLDWCRTGGTPDPVEIDAPVEADQGSAQG